MAKANCRKKIGDAAWEDCVALCPVAVLTTATENREQEVMLSSPVSLAPLSLEQSKGHWSRGTHSGYMSNNLANLFTFCQSLLPEMESFACKKYIIWWKYLLSILAFELKKTLHLINTRC